MDKEIEQRLESIERRLLRIEKLFPSLAPAPKLKRKRKDGLVEFYTRQRRLKLAKKSGLT